MHRFLALVFAATLALVPTAQAKQVARYVGAVQAQWLPDGRTMRLLAPFTYIDAEGTEWNAPAGSVIDGASIPKVAWSIIGGPFEGKYRDASVVHDVACEQRARPWEAVHLMFYAAMLTSGVDEVQAKQMYGAVYWFGPRWRLESTVPDRPVEEQAAIVKTALANAPPGSQVIVKSVKPRERTFLDIVVGRPQRADFLLQIEPPPLQKLASSDFDRLKNEIAARQKSSAGGMSLEEIRQYFGR